MSDLMRETMDWCDTHAGGDLQEIATLLEGQPDATGDAVLRLLWDAATGDAPDKPPVETEENVVKFYRRFPSLPILRPLYGCEECGNPFMSCIGMIHHQTGEPHKETAGLIAARFRSIQAAVS